MALVAGARRCRGPRRSARAPGWDMATLSFGMLTRCCSGVYPTGQP